MSVHLVSDCTGRLTILLCRVTNRGTSSASDQRRVSSTVWPVRHSTGGLYGEHAMCGQRDK